MGEGESVRERAREGGTERDGMRGREREEGGGERTKEGGESEREGRERETKRGRWGGRPRGTH